MKKNLAFVIVVAALLVSAPRLAVTFIVADGLHLSPSVAGWVFGATGVASGLVLTGGNVYIAHALAAHWKRRGGLWAILLFAWLSFLGFTVILVSPLLTYGIGNSVLATVLSSQFTRWGWAITAVVSVELLAAAAMAAQVLSGEPTHAVAQRVTRGAEEAPMSIWSALQRRIVNDLTGGLPAATSLQQTTTPSPAEPTDAIAPSVAPVVRSYTCAHCGRIFTSQYACAGHTRYCQKRQHRQPAVTPDNGQLH